MHSHALYGGEIMCETPQHAGSCCHMITVLMGDVAWNLDNLTR